MQVSRGWEVLLMVTQASDQDETWYGCPSRSDTRGVRADRSAHNGVSVGSGRTVPG